MSGSVRLSVQFCRPRKLLSLLPLVAIKGERFVEVCLDETNQVQIMLHFGSRGIVNAIGRYFIELAHEGMCKWFINLPDKDLAYLSKDTEQFLTISLL